MYTCMFQNSYVVMIITFVFLCLFFYLFEIGYRTEMTNDKVVKKFSWKYPLAISLIVWLVWHFYLYPPAEEMAANPSNRPLDYTPYGERLLVAEPTGIMGTRSKNQKINMINWN